MAWLSLPVLAGATPHAPRSAATTLAAAPAPLQGDQRIMHALNRLAFGPRPGDVEHVRQIGLGTWIAQQ